jgi:hypothetical protein
VFVIDDAGMTAIWLCEFGKRRPELPVIVPSSSENPSDVRRQAGAGASATFRRARARRRAERSAARAQRQRLYPALPAHTTQPQPITAVHNAAALRSASRRSQDRRAAPSAPTFNKETRVLGIAEKPSKHVAAIFDAQRRQSQPTRTPLRGIPRPGVFTGGDHK